MNERDHHGRDARLLEQRSNVHKVPRIAHEPPRPEQACHGRPRALRLQIARGILLNQRPLTCRLAPGLAGECPTRGAVVRPIDRDCAPPAPGCDRKAACRAHEAALRRARRTRPARGTRVPPLCTLAQVPARKYLAPSCSSRRVRAPPRLTPAPHRRAATLRFSTHAPPCAWDRPRDAARAAGAGPLRRPPGGVGSTAGRRRPLTLQRGAGAKAVALPSATRCHG